MVVCVSRGAELGVLCHRDDATGTGLNTGQGGVHVVPVGCCRLGGVNCLLSRGLSLGVEGGHDLQAATLDGGVTQLSGCAEGLILQQVVDHVAAEERLIACQGATLGLGVDVELNVAGDGVAVFLVGNLAVAEHGAQNDVAAFTGEFGVHGRVVHVRCLHQTSQKRGLRHVQVLSGNTPVVLCSSLNTVVRTTKVHDVQVAFKDLVLGLVLLHRNRKLHLANLCGVGLVTVQGCGSVLTTSHSGVNNEVVNVLLGQGGCTLTAAAVGVNDVVQERTTDTDSGDSTVVVEVTVLHRDDSVLHVLRNLIQLDRFTVLFEEGRDFGLAVSSVNSRRTGGDAIGNVVRKVLEP